MQPASAGQQWYYPPSLYVHALTVWLAHWQHCFVCQGSYGQGKSGNFEGVRESQGKQRGSGKSPGILKYCLLDQLFMHYFHNFCWLCPQPPTGAPPL